MSCNVFCSTVHHLAEISDASASLWIFRSTITPAGLFFPSYFLQNRGSPVISVIVFDLFFCIMEAITNRVIVFEMVLISANNPIHNNSPVGYLCGCLFSGQAICRNARAWEPTHYFLPPKECQNKCGNFRMPGNTDTDGKYVCLRRGLHKSVLEFVPFQGSCLLHNNCPRTLMIKRRPSPAAKKRP